MGIPLRVLMVEDSRADAELLRLELEQGGYEPAIERVDTPEAMKAELEQRTWDIILSDYVMPGFSGPAALRLAHERGINLPFIVVTGQVGEETAVEAMKAGAHDYVLKGNLTRLVPAIRREVQDAVVRRERREADEALRRAHEELRQANAELEGRVAERTAELEQKNQRLAVQNEELQAQSEEIQQQNEEIQQQNEEIQQQNEEIQQQNEELQASQDALLEAQRGLLESVEELRRKQAELSEAQRVAHIGSWVWDAKTGATTTSEELYRIVGLDPDSPFPDFGKQEGLIYPPESYRRLSAAVENAAQTGVGFELDLEAVRADGATIWITTRGEAVRDASGQIVYLRGTFQDITERKQAEFQREAAGAERERLLQELDAQRRLSQSVVDNATVGIAVLRGPRFVFELVNPTYQAIAPGKAFAGQAVAEVWPELASEVLPLLEGVLRTGEPYHATDLTLPVQRKPGEPLETAFFTFSYVPMPVRQDEEAAILVLVVETTEEVRTRQRVEELAQVAWRRAAEMRGILDNMVDGVFVCDAAGRITLANERAQMLGLGRPEEAHRVLAEFPALLQVRHEGGQPVKTGDLPLARALTGETVVQEDEVVRNPLTLRDIYLRTSAAPIRNEEGTIVGAVALTRDVTELTELDRLKEQFIAVAAHELKTPVAIMKGYAQALLRRAPQGLSPAQRKMLESVDHGADRIDRVVQDLLDISKLEAGQLELAQESVDLGRLVEQTVDLISLTTTRHSLRLANLEPVVVRGDRDRLEQVLANLLDNAIRYSPRGGEVRVAMAVADGEVVVSVRDEGVGIPLEKQGRIFQRFYRAHTNTAYDYGGMGVGLYISKEIVARHGGRVWLESEEGKGSTFYFTLPVAAGSPEGGGSDG